MLTSLKTLLALPMLAVLSAQQPFKITISRWSTTWPDPIASAVPSFPVKASGASVIVEADPELVFDAAVITLRYEQDGKRMRRWQIAFPSRHGCSPEPCQFVVSHFLVGDIDVTKASVEVLPLLWKSEEDQE